MQDKINKSGLMRYLLGLAFIILLGGIYATSNAQTITGDSPVEAGSTKSYFIEGAPDGQWEVDGSDTWVDRGVFGDVREVRITWDGGTPNGEIRYMEGDGFGLVPYADKSIVICTRPGQLSNSFTVSTNTCGNKTITYTGSLPSGVKVGWSSSPSGSSTILAEGNTFTASAGGTRTYYAWALNRSSSCVSFRSTSSRSVQVTVNAIPATAGRPAVTNNSCGLQVFSMVNPPDPATTGITWYWQTSPSGTSMSSSHPTLEVTNTGSHTRYLRARSNAGCWGTISQGRSTTVIARPQGPSVNVPSNIQPGPVTLSIPGTSPSDIEQPYNWYEDAATPIPFESDVNSITLNVTANTKVYVTETIDGCESNREVVDIIINSGGGDGGDGGDGGGGGTVPRVNASAVCRGQELVLTASSNAAGNFAWYHSADPGATPIDNFNGGGEIYLSGSRNENLHIVNVDAEATFYVALANTPDNRVLFSTAGLINPIPGISAPIQSRCGEGSVTLQVNADIPVTQYYWYKNQDDLNPWRTTTTNTVESDSHNENATYWVEAETEFGCRNVKRNISVLINYEPEIVSSSDLSFIYCQEEEITLRSYDLLKGNYGEVQWYDNNDTFLSGNHLLELGKLSPGEYVYKIRVKNGVECTSPFLDITISVEGHCDSRLNWVEITAFNENLTEAGATKNYFDLTGRPLQAQSITLSAQPRQVIGTQVTRDGYDREVLSTLPAPLNMSDFGYKYDFMLNAQGEKYGVADFDLPANKYNPAPVQQEENGIGTLGWYYSAYNTMEEHVPISAYPYSRTDYYDDGTGEIRQAGRPGEVLRLGAGHEVKTGTFPVFTELNHYLKVRDLILPSSAGQVTTLANEAFQQVTIDADGTMTVSITDASGNTVLAALAGGNELTINNTAAGNIYFYLTQGANITGSVRDIISGDEYTNTQLQAGMYQRTTGPMEWTNTLHNISYSFFDDAGRLVASIAPNGVQKILTNPSGVNSYTRENLPFTTFYEFDHQGRLKATTEPDAGRTEYLYRRDGSIRFSQNSEQRRLNTFSYTDYDDLGRPVESGEYVGTSLSFNNLSGRLEDIGFNAFTDNEKKGWIRTYYDLPGTNLPASLPAGFSQDFVMGGVSQTENAVIKTWYSYDEQGRITWMAQKPQGLDLTFVAEYSYDFLGNVLTVAHKSFTAGGNLNDQFYHHYNYDADQRLSTALTSLDGNITEAVLQARYIYYLHGPLKRIELADGLQGIDFVYNINGWLKSINHPETTLDPGGDGEGNGFKKDAFGMILNYYENNMTDLFNISSVDPKKNANTFHGLPGFMKKSEQVDIAERFRIFQPILRGHEFSPGLKRHSAGKVKYLRMLRESKKESPKKENGVG